MAHLGSTEIKLEKIRSLVSRWYDANKADYLKRYGPASHITNYDMTRFTEGKQFFHFIIGSSSAFMVNIETGTIYGIKAWMKIDRNKIVGNAYDPNFDAAALVRDRFRYGRFVNNDDGSLQQPLVRR